MRYERPAVVHREPVAALLTIINRSDGNDTVKISDAERKAKIVPVAWDEDPRSSYAPPAVEHRERIAALLLPALNSDLRSGSDVDSKDNVVPVVWEDASAGEHAKPSIVHREPLIALLDIAKSDVRDGQPSSDRNLKAHVVAVRWEHASTDRG